MTEARCAINRLFSIAILGSLAAAVILPSILHAQQTPNAQASPIELKIEGPGSIHVGQDIRFKITIINRLAHPILIADSSPGNMLSTFTWSIVDRNGKDVPVTSIHPGTFWIDTMGGPLVDDTVQVVNGGSRLIYKNENATDPTVISCDPHLPQKQNCMLKRVFPGRGVYHLRLEYEFGWHGEGAYIDPSTSTPTTKTLTLSPENIGVLKMTPGYIHVFSNEWTVTLE